MIVFVNTLFIVSPNSPYLPRSYWFALRFLIPILLAVTSSHTLFAQSLGFDSVFTLESEDARSVKLGDIDGDGDLDIVVGNSHPNQDVGFPYQIHVNNGHGQFELASGIAFGDPTDQANRIALGDVNGDGALDLVAANVKTNRLYINDGNSYSASGSVWGSQANPSLDVVLADMNGDGHLDIVAAEQNQNAIYLNDGNGIFYDGPTNCLLHERIRCFGSGTGVAGSVAVADIDGDGDLDIAQGTTGEVLIYRNDGLGNFSDTDNQELKTDTGKPLWSIAFGDMNEDGHLDLVIGARDGQNILYFNNGLGHFAVAASDPLPPEKFGTGTDLTYSIALADVNRDGHLDIIVGNEWRQNVIYLNNGLGRFQDGSVQCNDPLQICIPTGGSDSTLSIQAGDVDGDGDLDIVTGNNGQRTTVALSNGAGVLDAFSSKPFGPGTDSTRQVVLGDIDIDGDLDIVTANYDLEWLKNEGKRVTQQADFNYIYLNDGLASFVESDRVSLPTVPDRTMSIAVGDLNNDRYLDIVSGNYDWLGQLGEQNFISFNAGDENRDNIWDRQFSAVALGGASKTTIVKLGDMDGDQDLDIVVGNFRESNTIYFNDGNGDFTKIAPLQFGTGDDETWSLALGDVDNDNDLDIVVGNYDLEFVPPALKTASGTGAQDRIYYNVDGQFHFGPNNCDVPTEFVACFGKGSDRTAALTLGDINADGFLDIITGGDFGQPNFIFVNNGRGGFSNGRLYTYGTGSDWVMDVDTGDIDQDGDLDIVIAGRETQVRDAIYFNDGTGKFRQVSSLQHGLVNDATWSLALGDMNNDGLLDIVVGNATNESEAFVLDIDNIFAEPQNYVYLNRHRSLLSGNQLPSLTIRSPSETGTADSYSSPQVLTDTTIALSYSLYDRENDPVGNVQFAYSLDGGGQWFPASPPVNRLHTDVGHRIDRSQLYRPTLPITSGNRITSVITIADQAVVSDLDIWFTLTYTSTANLDISLQGPDGTTVLLLSNVGQNGAVFYGSVFDSQAITAFISGTLPYIGAYRPQGTLNAFNGKTIAGTWQLVIENKNTSSEGELKGWGVRITTRPTTYTYYWDTFASGFFGQSEDVVLRVTSFTATPQEDNATPFLYRNAVAGPFLWPSVLAETYPFRARGTQIQVRATSDKQTDLNLSNALIYRLKPGQSSTSQPIGDANGQTLHTDSSGLLKGRGQISIGDELFALLPISVTDAYTLYYTNITPTVNITPTINRPNGYIVRQPGIQELVVSSENPLILFNLDLSVEWNARTDPQFLALLDFNLKRTSELLYDWTNGQVALGEITVFHERAGWNDSHVRIFASNRVRPNADQGGIVSTPFTETITLTDTKTITYTPGQIRIGVEWNRYGNALDGNLGEDWPRALAHELAHYLFYLDDNYLGLDADGRLIPVTTCPGVMTDPYSDDDDSGFDEFHGDANWQLECGNTLSNLELGRSDWATIRHFYPPLKFKENVGPNTFPLAFTKIIHQEPASKGEPLTSPYFSIVDEHDQRYIPDSQARAYLFQGAHLISLGRPILDQVHARGTKIYDSDANIKDRVCLFDPPSNRFGCANVNPAKEQLKLDYLPDWQPDLQISPVSSTTLDIQVGNLAEGYTLEAQLYLQDTTNANEAIVRKVPLAWNAASLHYEGQLVSTEPNFKGHVYLYAVGRKGEAIVEYTIGGNLDDSLRFAGKRGLYAGKRGLYAPIASADGQAAVFARDIALGVDEFYAMHSATHIPSPPTWARVVGQAYRLVGSDNAPSLRGASLSLGYMGADVPNNEETYLQIYYWDNAHWRPLSTRLDTYQNNASAEIEGSGLYVLMSSIEITLPTEGWHLFSYPVHDERDIELALASIQGYYNLVYSYDATDVAQPWSLYATGVPTYVNTLSTLEFGQGYWIHVTEPVTISFRGESASDTADIQAAVSDAVVPYPPATIYGLVNRGGSFEPTAKMNVEALIADIRCGAGQTIADRNGEILYSIHVNASTGDGCGAPNQVISFVVGGQTMISSTLWQNSAITMLNLFPQTASTPPDLAMLSTASTTVAPGSHIVVKGTGLPRDTSLTIMLNGQASGSVVTDGNGAVIFTITTEAARAAHYVISFQELSSLSLEVEISSSAPLITPTIQGTIIAIPLSDEKRDTVLYLPIIQNSNGQE